MKPLKLFMQAFGPFAKYHVVDFQLVQNAPLFGFYGATGSGKTSILDAICFALFGKSSGGDREAETLRSDYASLEEESFVSLIFSVGEKRYFIHRIPDYEKKKSKGQGTTRQKHEAFLFEVTGMALDSISLRDNPGRLIAEKKTTLVLEKIIEILGYNAHQFRQVVMLPQGKFREFLTANSKSRSEILRQLFDLSFFERLESALKEKSKSLKQNLRTLSDQREGILHASGLESLALVLEGKLQKKQALNQVMTEVKACGLKYKLLTRKLEDARKMEDVFVLLEQVQGLVTAQNLQKPQMDKLETKLNWGKKSILLGGGAEKLAQAQKEARLSEALFLKMGDDKKELEKDFVELSSAFKRSEAKQKQRNEDEAAVIKMKGFISVIKKQAPLREDLFNKKRIIEEEEKSLKSLKQDLNKYELQIEKAKELEQSLMADRLQSQNLVSALEILKIKIDQLDLYQKKSIDVKLSISSLEKSQKSLAEAKVAFEKVDRDFKKLESLYFLSRAAYLAVDLKEDQACLVCGSKSHPNIATIEGEVMSDAAFKEKREAWEEQEKGCFAQANMVKRSEEKVLILKDALSDLEVQLKQDMTESASIEVLKQCFRDKERLLERHRIRIKENEKVLENCDKDEKWLLAQGAKFEKQEAHFRELKQDYIQREALILASLEVIPIGLQKIDVLEKALKEKKHERDEALGLHEKISAEMQSQKQKLTSAEDQERSLKQVYQYRQDEQSKISEHFQEDLNAQGFASQQQYQDALLKPEKFAEIEAEIVRYHQDVKVSDEKVSHYRSLIGEQVRPSVAQHEEELADVETFLLNLQEKQTNLSSQLRVLVKTEESYQAKTKEFEVLDQKCRRAQTLSDVANGTGDNQRKVRLVDWLLSSYFDDVLAQANLRFVKMTNHQFSLQRCLNTSKGRGVSGLDIEVYDAWSCTSRPAICLSGGESFLAALALALGLSDVVQQESGGIILETIFIDEGFGQLDEDALDHALTILTELSGHNRSVGLISHIEEVKRRVPAGFNLISSPNGSRIEFRDYGERS